MEIEYDHDKRDYTLHARGLDFARAREVFDGIHVTSEDCRYDYGERRYITAGLLDARVVVLIWTQRGSVRRIISMRYANDREKSKYSRHLD